MTDEDDNGEEFPPPPPVDIWGGKDTSVHYVVRHPWQWVMTSIRNDNMVEHTNVADLPSQLKILNEDPAQEAATPKTRRQRRTTDRKRRVPSTLKIEVCDANGVLLFAAHGSSSAMDGLEDKDELVRTMSRCRCEEKQISPPSILINWDVTQDECTNLLGKELPSLAGNDMIEKFAVLKEPMGSQGKGIFFVRTAEEIHKIVEEQQQRALKEPGFLDDLIAVKGRIPSWGKSYNFFQSLFPSFSDLIRVD
jgi:hypothetical protein